MRELIIPAYGEGRQIAKDRMEGIRAHASDPYTREMYPL